MAVSATDVKHYQSASMPTDDTTTAGGAISTTEIVNTSTGLWMPNNKPNASGGATKYQYQKAFVKNNHATDSLYNAKAYLENGLIDVAASGTAQVRIQNATDATGTTIRLYGFDASGNAQTEDIAISGSTSWVSGSKTWKAAEEGIYAAVVLDSSSGTAKTLSNVVAEIKRDVALGSVPIGKSWAIGFIKIGLVATLNDTGTSTNRVTAPEGISFSKPVTVDTGIAMVATIGAGDKQGVWAKQTLYPGMATLVDYDIVLAVEGDDA